MKKRTATQTTPHFSSNSLKFVSKAARQKNPEWLSRNEEEYESVLVEPMRHLMTEVRRILQPHAPGYRFPSRNFARIKRSKDRAVAQGWYKNYIGASISRDSGSLYEDLPALYFHMSEKEVFVAGGLYMPSARQIKQIRSWIDQDPSQMEALLKDRKFKNHFKSLGDERVLKTKPRDYPIDHPRIDWLKLTGWYVWREISKKELFSTEFAKIISEDWKQVLRFNQVLDHYTKSWPTPEKRSRVDLRVDLDDIRAPQVDWND